MKQTFYVPLPGSTNRTIQDTGLCPSEEVAFAADLRYPSEYKKLKSYTLNWRTRLVFECQANPCMFVTFTFDDEHYNVDDHDDDIRKAKLKKCWQNFIMRFRSHCKYYGIDDSRFKYYTITERGDDGRLHFHALIFGFDYDAFQSKNKNGQRVLYVRFNHVTEALEKTWSNGYCVFEAACPQNIEYVTKYLHKRKVSGDYISLKSNGLGLAFLDDAKKTFFKETDTQYFHIGRKKYYLPRYLKKKIWTDDEEYKAMNARLAQKIDEEEYIKAANKEKSENRHYVVYENSDSLARSCINYSTNPTQPRMLSMDNCSFDLGELKELLDRSLGFVYDPDDDDLQVYFCYDEPDLLKWVRLRARTNENFKMKYVYNMRL